jgi:hypothetical protein
MTLDEMAEEIKNMPTPTPEEIKQFWIDFHKEDVERKKHYEAERKKMRQMSYDDWHRTFDL